jgi:hypothetical protein
VTVERAKGCVHLWDSNRRADTRVGRILTHLRITKVSQTRSRIEREPRRGFVRILQENRLQIAPNDFALRAQNPAPHFAIRSYAEK